MSREQSEHSGHVARYKQSNFRLCSLLHNVLYNQSPAQMLKYVNLHLNRDMFYILWPFECVGECALEWDAVPFVSYPGERFIFGVKRDGLLPQRTHTVKANRSTCGYVCPGMCGWFICILMDLWILMFAINGCDHWRIEVGAKMFNLLLGNLGTGKWKKKWKKTSRIYVCGVFRSKSGAAATVNWYHISKHICYSYFKE